MRQTAKPKLLILTSSFPCGPEDETCGYVRQFARHLSKEFDVTVLAPVNRHTLLISSEPYTLARSSSLLPERLNPFQSSTDLNGLRAASLLKKIAAVIALIGFFVSAARLAWRADVICSHWLLPSGLMCAVLSRLFNKPHLAVEHSGALHLLSELRGGRWLASFIVARSHRVVVVSQDLRRKLIALCPEAAGKCDVIPMGVELNRVAQANRLHRLLFIGRLTRIKGADLLIEALRDIPGAQLIIAGDGPEREALERLAAERSINVTFLGHVNAARRDQLLAACDVVVLPSRVLGERSEGMPVVALEAMAAGCAVIAARTGGLAEIIRDTHNGLLFEPGDAQGLAEALRRLLNDAAMRARLGQHAIATAAEFAWPRIAAAYARLIKESLDQNAIHKDTRADAERAAC